MEGARGTYIATLVDALTPKLPSPLERPEAAVPHAGTLPSLPWKRLGASPWR